MRVGGGRGEGGESGGRERGGVGQQSNTYILYQHTCTHEIRAHTKAFL